MSGLGTIQLDTTGRNIQAAADGEDLDYMARGATVDWSTVAAVSADTVLPDDTLVKNGAKYLRYGQIMARIGAAEVQRFTWTGGPTDGAATLTFGASGVYPIEVVAPLAFNASAQDVATALQLLRRFQMSNLTVTRSGTGTAGDPYIYLVAYDPAQGNVVQPTATHTFTGGTTPSATIATVTGGVGSNKFGPFDSGASDGRQTLSRGNCFIVNSTHLESELLSDYIPALVGGLFFRKRLLITTGSHSLAAGPTVTEFEAAFPDVQYAS